MKNIVFGLLLMILSLYSCKENNNKPVSEQDNGPVKVELKDYFQVSMNVEVEKDDVFEVYFYETGSTTFHPRDFVSMKVNGGDGNQNLIIDLPDNIYPERLRLDFGKNKNQGLLKINSISLVFNEKEYEFSDKEIINEFKASKFIDFDEENLSFRTKVIDGKYDPYFYTKKLTNIVNFLLED